MFLSYYLDEKDVPVFLLYEAKTKRDILSEEHSEKLHHVQQEGSKALWKNIMQLYVKKEKCAFAKLEACVSCNT